MDSESPVQDYLDLIKRNRSWLAAPFLAVTTIGTVGAFLWPDTFVASGVFRIAPPAASRSVIPDVVSGGLADRVAAMQQTILNRSTLTSLIEAHKLYPQDRQRLTMEDVVQNMRRDVTVVTLGSGSANTDRRYHAFRLSYAYSNRFDAYRVTQNLVSRFLSENKAEQGQTLDSVQQFLRTEFEQAQAELRAAEAKLSEFRRASNTAAAGVGSPGLQLHNLSVMEARVSAANTGLGRARQEMVLLEAEVHAARERLRRPAALPRPAQQNAASPPGPVQMLELELDRLLARYKPNHPDVVRLREQIDSLRLKIPAVNTAPPPTHDSADPAGEDRLTRAEGQVRAKAMEMARLQDESGTATNALNKLQAAAATVLPDRSVEGEQLVREHELAVQRQRDIQKRMLESDAAGKLNRWNLAETLELVEAPALPESPAAPNRGLIILAAAVLGLLSGLAVVWLREANSESIWSVRQLRRLGVASVLAGIPLIENPLIVRRRQRVAFIGWASASLFSLSSIFAAAIYHYRQP